MGTRRCQLPILGLVAAMVLSHPPAHAHGVPPRFAAVMAEIGHRFTSLGEALKAKNDDLARYQARQVADLFERDLALATPPRPLFGMELEPLRRSFLEGPFATLRNSVEAHDVAAATRAFEATVVACNECHRTTGIAFVVVPGLGTSSRTTKSKVRTSPPR